MCKLTFTILQTTTTKSNQEQLYLVSGNASARGTSRNLICKNFTHGHAVAMTHPDASSSPYYMVSDIYAREKPNLHIVWG